MDYNIYDLYSDMYTCEDMINDYLDRDMYLEADEAGRDFASIFNKIIVSIKRFFSNIIAKFREAVIGKGGMRATIERAITCIPEFENSRVLVPDWDRVAELIHQRERLCVPLVKRGFVKKCSEEDIEQVRIRCDDIKNEINNIQNNMDMYAVWRVYKNVRKAEDMIEYGKSTAKKLVDKVNKLKSTKYPMNTKVAQFITLIDSENTQILMSMSVKIYSILYSMARKYRLTPQDEARHRAEQISAYIDGVNRRVEARERMEELRQEKAIRELENQKRMQELRQGMEYNDMQMNVSRNVYGQVMDSF